MQCQSYTSAITGCARFDVGGEVKLIGRDLSCHSFLISSKRLALYNNLGSTCIWLWKGEMEMNLRVRKSPKRRFKTNCEYIFYWPIK
jgi:hypothetical protein